MRRNVISIFVVFILIISCSTTTKLPETRIPQTKTQSPAYKTSQDLVNEAKELEKQLLLNPDDQDVMLRLAGIYQELDQFENALYYLERLKDMNYEDDPRLYGSLGIIYKSQERYEEAISSYQTFKTLIPEDAPIQTKIDEEITQLRFIINSLQNPHAIVLTPMSTRINTGSYEYLPQFTMDKSTIIFTRRFFEQEDLFEAVLNDSDYTVNPIEEINTLENEGAHSLSADGSLLIFTQCHQRKGFGKCDLYKSVKKADGQWSSPSNLGQRINSREWDSQPSLSADGRTLFFSSRREGGIGGSDIWISRMRNDGRWSVPENLGPQINSVGHEETPFIHPDGKTLYFRSNGHRGLGEFDLFYSTKFDSTWSTPKNLGSPINTTGAEGALVVSLDGQIGYYASDTYQGIKQKHTDIFQFDLPEDLRPFPMTFVSGRVTDRDSKLPIGAEIRIATINNNSHRALYKTNYNGEFLAAIPMGEEVLVNVVSDDYIFYSDYFYFKESKSGEEAYKLEIELETISSDITEATSTPVVLKNIFFKTGSAELLENSNSEILILFGLMKDNPEIKIEISGHTDNVGSEDDNLVLSHQRAESVKLALINKGIEPSRIVAIGKGESKPISENDTEEGRARNRRTEFRIL